MHVEPIAWITGEDSPNKTASRWAVSGTDLGICWEDGFGGVLVAFGDTFHPRQPQGGGGGKDWRSNVIAHSTNRDLSKGVIFDWMATDKPGHAREVLASRKINHAEMTVIPTGGCSVGKRNYLTYMSVKEWGAPGRWRTNYAGIAYADDGGHNWIKPERSRLANTPAGDHRFQMTALVHEGDYIYLFGTPNGRDDAAFLARSREEDLLEVDRYLFWNGHDWQPNERNAVPIIPAPVSELSVMYHRASRSWLAMYYRERDNAIVMHTSLAPTGPWSAPCILATAVEYPGLYGAFLHPWSADQDPVFLMSQWGPYNVRALRVVGLIPQPPVTKPPATKPPLERVGFLHQLRQWVVIRLLRR